METGQLKKKVISDGSRLIIEAMARAGADAFIGYPITPANLLYHYAAARIPIMLPAPDEISAIQWMAGLSATGHIPFTATSFPGFALMIESINMAFMMELPMVIVLVQRLGPATGTATCGAQGDLLLLRGMISGGYQTPVIAPSGFADLWELSAQSVHLAATLRTPVILLTSKEEVMTVRSFDPAILSNISPVKRNFYNNSSQYRSYDSCSDGVPPFLPVGSPLWQVRLNASTHDKDGILRHSTTEALENTTRLLNKVNNHPMLNTLYEYDDQKEAETLIISYGISSLVCRKAVQTIRKNKRVSLLILKSLIPLPVDLFKIYEGYKKIVVVEENITSQLATLIFGNRLPENVKSIGALGKMVNQGEIISIV